jgi:hypothetical protein
MVLPSAMMAAARIGRDHAKPEITLAQQIAMINILQTIQG